MAILCGKKRVKPTPKAKKTPAVPASSVKTVTGSPFKKSDPSTTNIVHKGTVSNGIIVDRFVPNPESTEVVIEGGTTYSQNLSYTDCGANNNKYYNL
jgi:hypothetical protein